MRETSIAARVYPIAVVGLIVAVLVGGGLDNLRRHPQPELVAEGIEGRPLISGVDLPSTRPDLVRSALSDLQALTLPNGGPLAGRHGPWRYVWPRDGAFVAAAWCAVGRYDEAARAFAFLDRIRAGDDGRSASWAARYHGDGSGPVLDGRAAQSDGPGWVLWAAFLCADLQVREDRSSATSGDRAQALPAVVAGAWPMLEQAADGIAGSLGPDGLPPVSSDYWERRESELTLGVVAPLLAGLRSAAALARIADRPADAERWSAAAERLASAIDATFGKRGYPRTVSGANTSASAEAWTGPSSGGADSIVTVLGPPFASYRSDMAAAIERAHRVLTLPNGGVTPGEDWRPDGVAWTPETALFGLSAAARGDRATAQAVLAWLDAHRTSLGALPEKLNREGRPAGEAPLAWTSALVVLTAAALDHRLPTP